MENAKTVAGHVITTEAMNFLKFIADRDVDNFTSPLESLRSVKAEARKIVEDARELQSISIPAAIPYTKSEQAILDALLQYQESGSITTAIVGMEEAVAHLKDVVVG